MKNYKCLTCSRMAVKWVVKVVKSLIIIPLLAIILFDDSVAVIFAFAFGLIEYLFSSILTGYGLSMHRAFIPLKIDEEGMSNMFCKIKWEEIKEIKFEHLKINKGLNRVELRYVSGNFGLVMLIHKKSNVTDKSFKNYSLRKTICAPLTVNVKSAIMRYCPEALKAREIVSKADEIDILECITRKKEKIVVVSMEDVSKMKTEDGGAS